MPSSHPLLHRLAAVLVPLMASAGLALGTASAADAVEVAYQRALPGTPTALGFVTKAEAGVGEVVIVTSAGYTVPQAPSQTGAAWTLKAQYALEVDNGKGWVEAYRSDSYQATTASGTAVQLPGVRLEVTSTKVADYRVVALLEWVDPDQSIVSQAWVTPSALGDTACLRSEGFDCQASSDRVRF